jgi:hypothetical protein
VQKICIRIHVKDISAGRKKPGNVPIPQRLGIAVNHTFRNRLAKPIVTLHLDRSGI